MALPDGRPVELVDLPGAYSLDPSSPDEAVTRDVLIGRQEGERLPDAIVVVVDATNLDNHLRFTLQLIALGLPLVVALNMVDLAERDGLKIDPGGARTRARRAGGRRRSRCASAASTRSRSALGEVVARRRAAGRGRAPASTHDIVVAPAPRAPDRARRDASSETAVAPLDATGSMRSRSIRWSGRSCCSRFMFVMFQAVFAWAQAPIGLRSQAGFDWLGGLVERRAAARLRCARCWSTGVITGVGAVVVFLPQILILFFFILLLEASGYMVRAAFLMDRLMARVGLSGRAFIPLLSSASPARCPGIMATRTIDDAKDRLTTILIAPLMTCSARLPVYTIIIGALSPSAQVLPGVGLQGLVLFALYVARHRRRAGRGAGAAPHRHQGRDQPAS